MPQNFPCSRLRCLHDSGFTSGSVAVHVQKHPLERAPFWRIPTHCLFEHLSEGSQYGEFFSRSIRFKCFEIFLHASLVHAQFLYRIVSDGARLSMRLGERDLGGFSKH